MSKYICQICGFVYDEAKGMPDKGIAPGTTWEQLPDNWVCPLCGAQKSQFRKEEAAKPAAQQPAKTAAAPEKARPEEMQGDLRALSDGELAALFSNLARGCEKQYKAEASALYMQLADYYTARTALPQDTDFSGARSALAKDIEEALPKASDAAAQISDRGAKRILVWSEKVSRMMASVLERYEKEGDAMLADTKIWVCDICGFLYIGQTPPAVCPVCKVPSFKILEVARV